MKKALILLITIFVTTHCINSQKYAVNKIESSLFENADLIVRLDVSEMEILDESSYIQRYKYVATILNENAKSASTRRIYYDNDSKVNYIKGALYNKQGDLIKKLKKSEISDQSAVSGGTLFSDYRKKVVKFLTNKYPYTVEFEWEVVYTQMQEINDWSFQSSPKEAVELSEIKITVPLKYNIRYKEHNVSNEGKITELEDFRIFTWTEKNIAAFEREPFSPSTIRQVPWLQLTTKSIHYKSFKRDINTWADYASFFEYLNSGRDELEEDSQLQIKEIVKNANDDAEKVEILYRYLQENTRYVSIQLGIGGFQPFEAKVVDDVKYGDCKALSNYMKAMLQVVGIEAYYTIIRSGNSKFFVNDLPSNQFNHAILVVPLHNDTIWLECTSQYHPMGYCGNFTGNRKALVLTNNGGEIWETPKYPKELNTFQSNIFVKINESGNAIAEVKNKYAGLQYENDNLDFYMHFPRDEQEKWMYERIDIPNFTIKDFSFENKGGRIPEAVEKIQLELSSYASVSGKRMFLKPNLMNSLQSVPKEVKERKNEVVRNFPYIDSDTILYRLPDGYSVEFIPEEVDVETIFGSYSAKVESIDSETIRYTRYIEMEKGRWAPETYHELRGFLKKIVDADKETIVLVKKE